MMRKIDHRKMGRSCLGWLDSWFHFSFAEYRNPKNMHYSVLRVVNDDTTQSHTDFEAHPHRDMKTITYVTEGELIHADSMQDVSALKRGGIQYMSTGTGIFHSEKNDGGETLRLLQIWILSDRSGYTPQHGEARISREARENRLLYIISDHKDTACVKIHRDMDIYASALPPRRELDIPVKPSCQVYLIVIEGEVECGGICLQLHDAMEIDRSFRIKALQGARVILSDMAREIYFQERHELHKVEEIRF